MSLRPAAGALLILLELGAKFDVRGFHDAVLGNGAVTLPILREAVDRWIASRKQPGA
jgi:uncharacterized protein (DUF885 family)